MVATSLRCSRRLLDSTGPGICQPLRRLSRVWVQPFYADEQAPHWREANDLPPSSLLIGTPYDPDARCSKKRSTPWTGYTVHLTESWEDESPHLIPDVQTTPAPVGDSDLTVPIEQQLQARS